MWYKIANNPNKQNPEEIKKALDLFAYNAVKNSLRLKRNYSPDLRLIEKYMSRFYEKLKEDYGSINSFILYTNGMSLKNLVEQNIHDIIG